MRPELSRRTAAAAAGLFLALGGTAAGGGLVVRPAHVELAPVGERGATARLVVTGSGAGRIRFRIRVEDFVLSEDGQPERRDGVSGSRSARPYLLVDPVEAVADGAAPATVLVHASLPADASGSYWALLVIEGEPSTVEVEGREIHVAPRLLVPLTLRAGETGHALLSKPVLEIVHSDGGSCSVLLSVENPGDVALWPRASVTVFARRAEGAVTLAHEELPAFLSLPRSVRTFRRETPCGEAGAPGIGVYGVVRWGDAAGEKVDAVAALRPGDVRAGP
jgi:hypothetical protein